MGLCKNQNKIAVHKQHFIRENVFILSDAFFLRFFRSEIFFFTEGLFTTQITFMRKNLSKNEIWYIHLGILGITFVLKISEKEMM